MRSCLNIIAITALVASSAALGAEIDKVHGSTQGLMTDQPQWSAGVQIGNYGATGLMAQRLGVMDGAVNLNLGLAYGGLLVGADYLFLYDQDFQRRRLTASDTYNQQRALVMPYFGAGVQVGEGLGIRLPIGLQYAMARDPFNFNGGATIVVGRFLDDDDVGIGVWFHLGAAVML